MNDSTYQELLDRAKGLMDERDSSIPPSSLPGAISMKQRTLSVRQNPRRTASEGEDTNIYPGDLVLSGSRVRVQPFGGFIGGSTEYFIAPTINGVSLFSGHRPSLPRRNEGAAVYIESVFEIYDRDTPSTGIGDVPYNARLIAANIVDRPLGAPYPIKKGVVATTVPDNDWTIGDSECKAYRLLGVYTADGAVYNQTILDYSEEWYYQTVELEDGRVIPPSRPIASIAPIKYQVKLSF